MSVKEGAAILESASPTEVVDQTRPTGQSDLRRWIEILLMLVQRDLQARSKQAYLGYVWILVQPLLLTGVFTFLVQRVLNRSDLSDVPYPVFLMAAMIPWQFCVGSLSDSADSLVKNVDLVRQVYFPREILAIYPIVARLVDVAIAAAALAVLMVWFHVGVSGWVLLAPVFLLAECLFLAAAGLLLAAANVVWRDVGRAIPLLMAVLVYAVPVLYTADRVPASFQLFFVLDPIAQVIENFRASVIGTHVPDLTALAVLLVVGVLVLALAERLFRIFDGVLADVV